MSNQNLARMFRSRPTRTLPERDRSVTPIAKSKPTAIQTEETRGASVLLESSPHSLTNRFEAVADDPVTYVQSRHCHERGIRAVHVRGVPEEIWLHARKNCMVSQVSFRDYVIQLLASSQPLPQP